MIKVTLFILVEFACHAKRVVHLQKVLNLKVMAHNWIYNRSKGS